ncbi:DISARM system phospholipase D-like protein DrmC [[Kitasatospora] papulosa]|uniref:DISARM system phospholipase D-like protein DrmC n=1 Tax=[Kitasatospora] papulosa TaxID=1464011 RepID=UPI00367EF61F
MNGRGGAGHAAVPPDHRSLAEVIAGLCSRLPEDRLASWVRVLAHSDGPDDPALEFFTASQTAPGLSGQLAEALRAWRRETPALPGAALALAVCAARAVPRPSPVQPVVSGPVGPSIPTRLTGGVALDIIRSARSSLLIASFAAHGATDAVNEVQEAMDRGVTVDLLLEESTQASSAFRALPQGVRIWHRQGTSSGVFHAKLIAADRHTALVGSANLTDRALTDNIELGVVLRGADAVGPLVDHFRWLIARGSNLMRRA